jgi:hypothetical protein
MEKPRSRKVSNPMAVQSESGVGNETKWLTKPSYTRTNRNSLCAVLWVGGGQIDPS